MIHSVVTVFSAPTPRRHTVVARGLTLILLYLRREGLRSLTVKRIARCVATDTHYTRTIIGHGLSHLARLGFLIKWTRSSPVTYVPTQAFYEWLQQHPCLDGCASDGGVCGLYGTPYCPFLQGVSGGGRRDNRADSAGVVP